MVGNTINEGKMLQIVYCYYLRLPNDFAAIWNNKNLGIHIPLAIRQPLKPVLIYSKLEWTLLITLIF